MAAAYSGTSTVGGQLSLSGTGAVIPEYMAQFIRENTYPHLYLRALGTEVTIPRASGTKVRIPKFSPPVKYSAGSFGIDASLSSITSSLGESTVPSIKANLATTQLTGQLTRFEGAEGYTDKAIIVTRADLIAECIKKLGREAAFRFDSFYRAALTGANVKCAAGITTNKTVAVFRAKELVRAATLMDTAGVPRFEDNTFVGLLHPLAQYDIMTDLTATGFVPTHIYGQPDKIYSGEVGTMYGTRLLFSPVLTRLFGAASTSATNYLSPGTSGAHAMFFSPDSFFTIALAEGGLKLTHNPPGSSGISDPTAKLGSIGVDWYTGIAVTPVAEMRRMSIAHATSVKP